MSRIGARPITIPESVNIEITGSKAVAVCGEKKLELLIPSGISIKKNENILIVQRSSDSKEQKSLHGLISRLLINIISGVKDGFVKELTFNGTGYRAALDSNDLVLNMGYSHETRMVVPEELKVEIKKNTIIISGIDKVAVGQFAATVRKVRPPEVYKGKGIKYKDEFIKRKAGKKAAA